MEDDRSKLNIDAEQDPDMECCAPGCYCKKIPSKTKSGVIIALIVAIIVLFGSMYICGNRNHLTPTWTHSSPTGVKH